MECTSPIHSRVGSHVFLLSLFLCRFNEPVKLFPSVFIKMVFIHFYLLTLLFILIDVRDFQFCLMPTPGYLCRYSNKPIYKGSVFLLFIFIFLLAHHQRYVVCQYAQLASLIISSSWHNWSKLHSTLDF